MSIYATIPGLDTDAPCGPPWQYQGSHRLPDADDPRGATIDLALIPSHITRDWRDDGPEDGTPWPWLRLAVDDPDGEHCTVLDPAQARYLAQLLADWADQADGSST